MMELQEFVNNVISDFLPNASEYPSKLGEAMVYAMTAGGKRIRPTLMYLSFMASVSGNYKSESERNPECFDDEYDNEQISDMPVKCFMAAIEMIHTHSLIHDDLPALDNDTLRRGRPTVHVEFDESTAILAGDALLNYAYETAHKAYEYIASPIIDILPAEDILAELDAVKSVVRAEQILLRKTGINGMLGGQGLDVQLSGSRISDADRDYINENKTCALIEAPLMIGATLARADEDIVAKLEEVGRAIGMAFQVQDDILDVIGDAEKLGKEVNQDERNEKNTYVAQYGLDASKKYVREQSEKAIRIVEEIFEKSEYRDELVSLIEGMIDREF